MLWYFGCQKRNVRQLPRHFCIFHRIRPASNQTDTQQTHTVSHTHTHTHTHRATDTQWISIHFYHTKMHPISVFNLYPQSFFSFPHHSAIINPIDNWLVDWLIDWLIIWIDWLIDRSIHRWIYRAIDWSVGLSFESIHSPFLLTSKVSQHKFLKHGKW